MKLYKLTDMYSQTYRNTEWGEGVSHSGTGVGRLCGPGWIHAYRSPLLAVFMNPAHADFKNPLLWEAEGKVAIDDGSKVGCKTLTTIRKISIPIVTNVQRIAFGILAMKEIYKDGEWNKWADEWLSGEDRSYSQVLSKLYSYSCPCVGAGYICEAVFNYNYGYEERIPGKIASAVSSAMNEAPISLVPIAEEAMKY